MFIKIKCYFYSRVLLKYIFFSPVIYRAGFTVCKTLRVLLYELSDAQVYVHVIHVPNELKFQNSVLMQRATYTPKFLYTL
jgi:hypothetical protein